MAVKVKLVPYNKIIKTNIVLLYLAHYCPRYPIFNERFRFGKIILNLEILTRSMLCITELHNKFYLNKVKVIKPSIYNDLTPVELAH